MRFSWVWLLALVLRTALAQETSLNIVELSNRPAADLVGSVEAMLEPGERVIANGFSLILKCRPERYSALEQLIQQLDRPQTNLLISVIQNSSESAEELNAALGIGLSRGGIRMNGMAGDTQSVNSRQQVQQIRTLDGQPAHIESGEQRPIETVQIYDNGYGYGGFSHQTQLQTASSGFVVVPQLIDDKNVMLDISPWTQQWQAGAYGQQQQQSLHTSVRAPLGTWVEIGGQNQTANRQQHGMTGLNYRTDSQDRHTLIKIDKAR